MGRCMNLLSLMEGEIVRTSEAGGFGLHGVKPAPVPLPITQLKCQICPFVHFKCYLYYHFLIKSSASNAVQHNPFMVVCLSPSSVSYSHSTFHSFPALNFKTSISSIILSF